MRGWLGWGVVALLGFAAAVQAQPPPAPPLPERPLWQPDQAWYIRQWQVTGATSAQLAQVPASAWSGHASWQDQVNLPAPAGETPPGAHRFAAATVTSAEARDVLVSVGSAPGHRVWLNGAPVGRAGALPAYYPDAVRHPARLRAGDNRLVIELDAPGAATFSVRLLAPGAVLPPRREIAPAVSARGGALDILTDAAGARPGLTLHVAAIGPGGRVLGEGDAAWGARLRLPMAGWPDGPLELHVTGRDQRGERVFAWLRWYKGDPGPALRSLREAAAAAPPSPLADHLRYLVALVDDAPGDRERLWGLLLEYLEWGQMWGGGPGAVRPNGFLRLPMADPVDGSTQYCRIYLPDGYDPARRWPLVVNLHGWHPENPVPVRWWGVDSRHVAEAERHGVIWAEPHGRGNMDWREAGEDDVLRCIAGARQWLKVDEDRIYLTGLSMGGAGTWTIAAHNPGLFAAIAPVFGGWDYRLTGRDGWADPEANLPVERWHQENQNRFAGIESLNATPVFVTHGDRDEAVPVLYSRYVVTMLQRWGYDISYHEIPGRAHEEIYARDRIVPWLLSHRRAEAPHVARVRATGLREASSWWLSVTEYERPLEVIEARAEVLEPGVVRLDTVNVAALRLTLPPALRGTGASVRLIWNGAERRVPAEGGAVRAAGVPVGLRKTPARPGGMSDIFRTPVLIVHGPGAAERAAAGRIAAIWRASQHLELPMVPDSDVTEAQLGSRSLILVGGTRENAVSRRLAAALPMQVDAQGVTLMGRRVAAPDSVGQLIRPSPRSPELYLLMIAAASPAAMARWDADSIWRAPYGSPAQPLDWAVGAVMGAPLRDGLDPSRRWVGSGVFGADWGLDPRWVFAGGG